MTSLSFLSMSVLVIVEMFNALNALSENASLIHLPPWTNMWLLGAIALSVLLHVAILYNPTLASIFSVVALGADEWRAVLYLSFPVILIDEILKLMTRNLAKKRQRDAFLKAGLGSLLPYNKKFGKGHPKDDAHNFPV